MNKTDIIVIAVDILFEILMVAFMNLSLKLLVCAVCCSIGSMLDA